MNHDEKHSFVAGFGKFLHRLVACELEDLSRCFYHHESRKDEGKSTEVEQSAADPVLAVLIPTLRGTLESGGNELHALALMEPLTNSVQPLTKKSSRCTQIYQSALLKVQRLGMLIYNHRFSHCHRTISHVHPRSRTWRRGKPEPKQLLTRC